MIPGAISFGFNCLKGDGATMVSGMSVACHGWLGLGFQMVTIVGNPSKMIALVSNMMASS